MKKHLIPFGLIATCLPAIAQEQFNAVDEGKAVFTEMLALFVDDGLLENWEIQKLVDILEKFGLCQNHEDGLRQIQQIVDEEYPDVVFERTDSENQ